MIVIMMRLVFTIIMVIIKLLHYNGLYKTKCKLFKVTYCRYCNVFFSLEQYGTSSICLALVLGCHVGMHLVLCDAVLVIIIQPSTKNNKKCCRDYIINNE